MKIACIILASGNSIRFGKSKLFYKVYGTPIIEFTLKNISKYINKDHIYITIPKKLTKNKRNIISKYSSNKLIYGSKTRFHSLKNAIYEINHVKYDYLMIHDAARPITPNRMFKELLSLIKKDKYHCVAPCSILDDTLRKNGTTLNKNNYITYQTPQIFKNKVITEHIHKIKHIPTDDLGIIEKNKKLKVKYIESSKNNIKITRQNDIDVFKALVNSKISYGNGFDLHKLKLGNFLALAGLKIKSKYSAVGHSDGDVVLHSIIDALLGASKKGDIGKYFPSLNKYKDISSRVLLNETKRILNSKNLIIHNLDCTIICQEIRLEKYKKYIRKNIANLTNCKLSNINVKAKTSDNIGIIGRSKAIACWVTIKLISI